MSNGRLWLAFVLASFCLPLFVGLGQGDIRDDEAIYSFAVDSILETGQWLEPKSIPSETAEFLEKPPLKFWIVALPIHLGLVPHNQFGLRFWDALFGAWSFVYVFLLGSRLLNPVCGTVAVLLLFAHSPLLFEHGLRSNNMEAPLLLCYCGGVYHYLAWVTRKGAPSVHAVSVGLYFVLGFMTKFVAALFLPFVLALATVVVPAYRRLALQEWRLWSSVGILVIALTAPWFAWEHVRFGASFWQKIVGEHVYTRFAAYLDPGHLQPWYFYPVAIYERFPDLGTSGVVLAGMALLVAQSVRRRWPEALVIVLWAVVPLALMSLGSSKIYHSAYPFLPPLALGGGYLVALGILLLPLPLSRALRPVDRWMSLWSPRLVRGLRSPGAKRLLLAVGVGAVVMALASQIAGTIRVNVGGISFKNSGAFRPGLVAVLCAVLVGWGQTASRVSVGLVALAILPLPAYARVVRALGDSSAPMRSARECVLQVQAMLGPNAPGLYVDVPANALSHPLYYYFRHVRPWTRAESRSPEDVGRYLTDPGLPRPMLVWEPVYQEYKRLAVSAGAGRVHSGSLSMIVFEDLGRNTLLLLPGAYAACGPLEQ